jgi:hypothetical protein
MPSSRPATLTAAVGAAITAAALMIIGAVAVLAGGVDVAKQQVADHTIQGADPVDPALIDPSSDRVHTLQTSFAALSYDTIGWALVLAVLAYFALRGGRTTRIISTIILVASSIVMALDLWLSFPMITKVTSGLTGVLALVAIVLFFLPASNAYGRSRRAARG